jgi:hypothetical protein
VAAVRELNQCYRWQRDLQHAHFTRVSIFAPRVNLWTTEACDDGVARSSVVPENGSVEAGGGRRYPAGAFSQHERFSEVT